MIGRKNSTSKIDETAFQVWAKTGSLDNARLYFQQHKILKNNGKQYSVAGIRFCAMRFMVHNYEYAMSFLVNEYEKCGIIPNKDSLELTVVGYATEVFHFKSEVMEWAEGHGLLEKYQSVIDDRTRKMPLEAKRRILAKFV